MKRFLFIMVSTALLVAISLAPPPPNLVGAQPDDLSGIGGTISCDTCLSPATLSVSDLNPLGRLQPLYLRGGYVAAGIGMRNWGFGTISISGIPNGSSIRAAYLYWDILANLGDSSFAQGQIDGNLITGTLIGVHSDPCWGNTNNFAYRADVTSFVRGNGDYSLSDFASGTTDGRDPWEAGSTLPMAEGASLVVVYENSRSPWTQVIIYDGSFMTSSVLATQKIGGFMAPSPVSKASITFIGGDGQDASEPGSRFNGSPLTSVGWDGNDTQAGPSYSRGNLWDTMTADVTSFVYPGDTLATATVQGGPDCLVWVALVFSVQGEVLPFPRVEELSQARWSDNVEINPGDSAESNVVLKGKVYDPAKGRVKLQTELRRLDEFGGGFTGEPTQESDWVSSGKEASITVYDLIPAPYHWRARVVDETGNTGPWVSFGGNPDSAGDFRAAIQGTDCYWGAGNISWSETAAAGYQFALIKATQGTSIGDAEWFKYNWEKAKEAGLIVGAWHYAEAKFHPGDEGAQAEAQFFYDRVKAQVGGFSGGLPPILDVEDPHSRGLGKNETARWIMAFFDKLKDLAKADGIELQHGIVYSYVPFLNGEVDVSQLIEDPFYLFWVARVAVSDPSTPSRQEWRVWDEPWAFWQYVGNGKNKQRSKILVPGFADNAKVDLDFFNGSIEELNDLIIPQ